MLQTRRKLATVHHLAAQEYEPWPADATKKLGSRSEFLARCSEDHGLIRMALAVMQRDHEGNAAVAAAAPEGELQGFVGLLRDAAGRYRGLAEMLDAAETRVVRGVARHCVATGKA